MKEIKNREQWLQQAVGLAEVHFSAKGFKVPVVHVACGFPSHRALSGVMGECWDAEASKDGLCQVFVSPLVDDPVRVMDILIHELVHTVVGIEANHGKVFRKCALAVGLTGKMTSTVAGPELKEILTEWAKKLGEYPNSAIVPNLKEKKKQTTRMVKAECQCGYVVRLSKKWIEEVGWPHCPKHGEMKGTLPEEKDNDEDPS